VKKPLAHFLDDPRGFALPAVLVFALLLSLSAFASAFLTRTDVQIVNNGQNEKEAFYVAEAGVTEAELRLGLAPGTMVTVDGNTFDASIKPTTDPNWVGTVLFTGSGPVATLTSLTTPSIQSASSRLPYTNVTADSETLTLRWAKDASNNVLQIAGRNVLEIVSTGQAGTARRRVTLQTTQVSGISLFVYSDTACPALSISGSVNIKTAGGIQVNSSCATAVSVGGSSATKASAGNINVVGGISGNPNSMSPPPTTGVSALPDPLADKLPPCFQNYAPASGCVDMATLNPGVYGATPNQMLVRNASQASPSTMTISGNKTLNPGIYYGGLTIKSGTATMNPGVYVMAGGGFTMQSGSNAVGSGVMIYNTNNPGPKTGAGLIASVAFSTGSGTVNLSAPSTGTYQGLLIFQDRDSTTQPAVTVQGGFSGTIDGVIYAIKAPMQMQGGCVLKTELVVGTLTMGGNAEIQPPPHPLSGLGAGGFSPIAWLDY
jgi:Tfp pilus assembly protein PilX